MTDLSVTILPETAADAPAIERLHERTFGPGRFARTAYRVRERAPHLLNLSFTAWIGTLLVGSVRLSPIRIGEVPALLLGPLTIEPPFRGRGIGAKMLERALDGCTPRRTPAWWCWSVTSLITPGPGSSGPPSVVSPCRARSIRRDCWSPNWLTARSKAFPEPCARIGML